MDQNPSQDLCKPDEKLQQTSALCACQQRFLHQVLSPIVLWIKYLYDNKYLKFVQCCYSGFFCDILSLNVKMYLWLKLYTVPFFVSGQTYKISKGSNNCCSHCNSKVLWKTLNNSMVKYEGWFWPYWTARDVWKSYGESLCTKPSWHTVYGGCFVYTDIIEQVQDEVVRDYFVPSFTTDSGATLCGSGEGFPDSSWRWTGSASKPADPFSSHQFYCSFPDTGRIRVWILISMWYFSFSFLINLLKKYVFAMSLWVIQCRLMREKINVNYFNKRLQHDKMWKMWRGPTTLWIRYMTILKQVTWWNCVPAVSPIMLSALYVIHCTYQSKICIEVYLTHCALTTNTMAYDIKSQAL